MLTKFLFLLLAVTEAAELKKKTRYPLKRGGLSSKVMPKSKSASGIKIEGSSHQVKHGMTQLHHTLNKIRGAAADGNNGMTDEARKQFMRVVESAMKMEDKMEGSETSETFRQILFESQLLMELMDFKHTGKIDVDATVNLLEAETYMFQERNERETMKLEELIGMDIFEELEISPDLFEDIYGYSDDEGMFEGFGDEISIQRKNELLELTNSRWSKLEPRLKAKGFTAPGKLTDVKNTMFWWVEAVDRLMLVQNVASTATILNFTMEVGGFLKSEPYKRALHSEPLYAAKASATGLAIEQLGKQWFASTKVVELSNTRKTFMSMRGQMIDAARHAPKDMDASMLHLSRYGEEDAAFHEAFTGGMGRVVLKEEFSEELFLPEDCTLRTAWYGDALRKRGINVTDIVKKRLKAGERVYASNELFGDSAYGVGKFLYVDYMRKETREVSVSEEFPDNIDPIAPESVTKAFYGTQDRTRGFDVTTKVKELLKAGYPVNASYEVYGDPAYGIGKHLFVEYNERMNSVSDLLESKFYAMKLIIEAAQNNMKVASQPHATTIPVFIPDVMNALLRSVSRIQNLKETDLMTKVVAPQDYSYFTRGVMSLRDMMSSFTFKSSDRLVVGEI